MTIILVTGVWVIAIVQIILLWNFVKFQEQINRLEVEQEIGNFTLSKLSASFIRPGGYKSAADFNRTMEH